MSRLISPTTRTAEQMIESSLGPKVTAEQVSSYSAHWTALALIKETSRMQLRTRVRRKLNSYVCAPRRCLVQTCEVAILGRRLHGCG